MAVPTVATRAEIYYKGACGETGEATGPQSNEFLQPDAKPNLFARQMSPAMSQASTAPPSPSLAPLDMDSPWSSAAFPTSRQVTPFDFDSIAEDSDKEQCEHEVAKMWTVTRGAPTSMSQLEERLSDVKALYKVKYGRDIHEEDDDDDDNADAEDDIIWTVTRGALPSTSELENSLSDVKALYRARFGQDVDSEDNVVAWLVARGAPPSLSQLEDRLSDVKALYRLKFGKDVDSEEEEEGDNDEEGDVEHDGVTWTVTRGAPPSMSQLEDRLSDVEALYKSKFGEDFDAEHTDYKGGDVEKDGVMWTVTRGAPPSMPQLEDRLSDVKALYKAKFGEDVDAEDGEDEGGDAEEDGVMWTVVRGAPPSMPQLEDRLSDVKALYTAKYGKNVDAEDGEDEEGGDEKDCVMSTVTRGAPPSIAQLEDRLSDVKALYTAKYGENVDAEEGKDEDAQTKHGVMWTFMSMWACFGGRRG